MAKNSHSHNTRRAAKNHLQLHSSNTKFGGKTFASRASKIWNDLPPELLELESLLKFKTSVNDQSHTYFSTGFRRDHNRLKQQNSCGYERITRWNA